MSPADELAALADHYGLDPRPAWARLAPALARYTEWVLGRDGLAVVTLGEPGALAGWVAAEGPALPAFQAAASAWPDAITGIKLDLSGTEPPTLYVRTRCPWAEGLRWLLGRGLPALDLPPARTLYGLGFQGEVVKVYTLSPDGFLSWRLDAGGVHPEHKAYRAEVPWAEIDWPDARWAALGALGARLGFETAGHVGARSDTGERKLYVERRGGLPTDRSLA